MVSILFRMVCWILSRNNKDLVGNNIYNLRSINNLVWIIERGIRLNFERIDFLEKCIKVLVISILSLGILILSSILGTILGAFVGWCISLFPFLRDWITGGLSIFGIDIQGRFIELGAILGFIEGFFKATISLKKEDN